MNPPFKLPLTISNGLIMDDDGIMIAEFLSHDQATCLCQAVNHYQEMKELLTKLNEQLNCPARNTTRSSFLNGSVIISTDIREAVKSLLTKLENK